MGTLDDAIREHLELKRKHGARDTELQQLEDEAFGPPSRPGEPDFPERPPTGEHPVEEAAEARGTLEERGIPVAEAEPEAELAVERDFEEEEMEAEERPERAGFFDQATVIERPAAETDDEETPRTPPEEHEVLGERELDAVPEPGAGEAVEAEPPAPVEEGEEGYEIGEFDLELDDEFADLRDRGSQGEAISVPTEEHPLEDLDRDQEEEEDEEVDRGPRFEGTEEDEEDDDEYEYDEPEDEGEDVLEETPEFLRGTPENERLWFEQGEPQDFDFEDEDE